MTKNNALPPASQPWVRELEKRIKDLENKSYRTDSKVNVMSNRVMSPKVDLDALSVTEIRVGGEEPQVFEHEVQNYSISGNTITASTPPVPTQRGFIMEWEVDVTASADYIQASSSLDSEMYEDPEEPEGAPAGEETTFFADASYMIEEDEDELFKPVPPIVSFTLHNPANTEFTFTVHAMRMRFVIPGEGGLRITQEGEIFFEDGAGRDSIFREITDEQAQAIIETANNLKQAQQDLEDARTEAEQNFGTLDDKLGQAFPDNIFDVDLAIEQAKQLAEQQFNDSITGTIVEYSLNANETAPPITGWSTTPPARTPGTFIWMRTTVSYGSGDTSTTDPVLLTGNAGATGPQGPQGPRGPQGVRGPDGPQGQALYTWIKYAPNGNPTSEQMSESPVGMTYMGIAHNQTTQAEGTDPTAYSWSLIKGPQGDTGIQGPDGADGQSLYTWVKYAPNGSPTASQITDTPQATSTHIGLAYNKPVASESTVPGDYTWSLIKGPKGDKGDTGADGLPGAAGVGVSSTEISYVRSANGSVAPDHSAGWNAQPPSPIKGQYLWTRTKWNYTDGSSEYGYSSAYWATDGADGTDGLAGKDGTKLTGTVNEYAQSTSGTVPPSSGWASQPPTPVAGRYMWTRTTWTYDDGSTEYGYAVGKIGDTGARGEQGERGPIGQQGPQGPKGDKGDTGSDGLPGAAGKGIKSTDISYARSTSGSTAPASGWQSTPPSPIKGQYLWTRTVWTYTDNATETGYSSAYWAQDGAKGNDGAAGKDGTTLTGTVQHYAQSTSGTTPPTSGWVTQPPTPVPGRYMWTRSTWSYSDGTTEYGYTVGKIGDTGASGDQGVSVTSITPHFRRLAESAAKPAKPSGMTPSGWVAVEPDYARDTTMWRSDRIVFSNGQITWTDVSKLSSYEAAKAAEAAALAYADQKKQEAIDAGAHDLANLEIGGRNLVHNSGGVLVNRLNSLPGSRGEYASLNIGQSYMGVADGTTVTVSFDLEMEVNTNDPRVMIYNTNSSGPKRIGNVYIRFPDAVAGDYINERVSATTVILDKESPTYTDNYIEFYSTYDTSNWFKISNLKVERGNKATDWTPAPEDVDKGIADAKADASTAVQRANAAVRDTKIEYAVNTSQTSAPTSGWSTATPTRTPGSFIWMRTTITYGDGTPSVLAPVLVTGNDGATGSTGAKGDPGSVITSSVVEYAQSTSGTTRPTTWSTTVPTPVEGRYIWTRTTFKYTVGPDQYSYSVGKIGEKGSTGAPGSTGAKGDPGTTLTGTALHYTQTTSGTTIPSSGWVTTIPSPVAGRYMWTRTTWSFSDKPDQYGYSVALNGATGAKGDKGDPGTPGSPGAPGTPGVSVSSVTPFFRKATSKPAQPSGTGTPSGWTTTEPAYTTGTKLWRSERVLYSNSTAQWTPVTEVATYTGIDAAMTMASGKNAVSYTTFGSSSIEPPGTAPTTSMGSGRRVYDMHRNRLTDGTIIGEWMWTGSAWTQLELSDAMLSSLDVGKLTAGTANIETAVINQLWGQLGVFDKLDVRTDAYVSGINLKDGAVTARTLNVVPSSGTGGVEILPPGFRIIPADEENGTTASLRVDEESILSFSKGGDSKFSVNQDGLLSAQEVSANDSLVYQGTELQELLDQRPRGVLAIAHNGGSGTTYVGTSESRLLAVSLDVPPGNRAIRISYEGRIAPGAARHAIFSLRQSDTGTPTPNNSLKWDWESHTAGVQDVRFSRTTTTQELGWPASGLISVGLFVQSKNSSTLTFYTDQRLIVEDLGPAVEVQSHRPWVPSTGGGTGEGSETQPVERDYTYRQKSSWVRSFLGNNNFYNYGAGRAYQGPQPYTNNGNLKSMIGWPSLTSMLNDATIKSIKIRIKNNHTYAYSGGTAHIGLHSRSSAPTTLAYSVTDAVVSNFTRGQTKTLTIPSQYYSGFKSGSYTGITLYSSTSSLSKYGYWDGTNAELIIEYRK